MKFTLHTTDPHGAARAGTLHTAHGDVPTPIFMPVGTIGTVKGIHQHELKSIIQAHIVLGNTYHLYLRPGQEVVAAAGGLHKFINWDGPMLTDSGGYQVFSLAHRRKIKEDGVTFQSHVDGSRHLFTPESVMDVQRQIGADIVMAFDECAPYPATYAYARKSMEMTHRWLERCQTRFAETEPVHGYEQALFPIIQGSTFDDLRRASAEFVANTQADGYAIGGLSVGEPADVMYHLASLCCNILPQDKPRYLMGVGTPANLLENIALGVDMFDCVMPTRNARTGFIFTRQGIMNLRNKRYRTDNSPLDPHSLVETSRTHSRAYVAHLLHTMELTGAMIASLHNLSFYTEIMREAREQILAGTFTAWKNEMAPIFARRI